MSALTEYYPMFPLNLILLPGEQTELHLFEPRYRELYKDLKSGNGTFVIPYIKGEEISDVGCKVQLVETIKEYDDGKADILIESDCIVQIKGFETEADFKTYPGGKALEKREYSTWEASNSLLAEFDAMRSALGKRAEYLTSHEYKYVLNILSFLHSSSEDKYAFLMLNNSISQQKSLTQMVRFARLILEQEKELEHGFFMN